jgi:hypothetical protein
VNHGNYTCYKRGCRCKDCSRASADYMRRYRAGHRVRVDASEARVHIEQMLAAGHSTVSIARAAGDDCTDTTVRNILKGTSATVHPRVADAIMATPIMAMPPGGKVPAGPAAMLIREMGKAGISHLAIEAMLGTHCCEPGRWPSMYETTWRRFRVLYELLARQGIVPASVLEEVS